jgi:5-bromo-4-chloroindolyl phosphate hydrolysis protein
MAQTRLYSELTDNDAKLSFYNTRIEKQSVKEKELMNRLAETRTNYLSNL